MTTSIQVVGKRAETFDDLDLLGLLALVNEVRFRSRGKLDSLKPFIDSWKQNCIGYGPGMIDLDLEQISASVNAKSELEQLLKTVENRLGDFGETIPATTLMPWCEAPGVVFNDFPTMRIKKTIERIRGLMS